MIVLNYHSISDQTPSDNWTLSEDQFAAHFSEFSSSLISPETFFQARENRDQAYSRKTVLTFDDAYLSDYDIVYSKYFAEGHIPGFMSFIPTDWVGQKCRMQWSMIDEIHRSGNTIGSHGLSHQDLTKLDRRELQYELVKSKEVLEDKLGTEIPTIAFPYGRFSLPVCKAAIAAGYESMFSIQLGYHNGFMKSLYSRLCVTHDMDQEYLRQYLANPNGKRNTAWKVASATGLYPLLMKIRYRR